MTITTSLVLILCFILAYIIIIGTFSIAFQASGLTSEKARYQAISIFTNCGFTTTESELITSDRYRRKLAAILMIIGHIFAVLVVSLVVALFDDFNTADVKENAPLIGIFVVSLLAVFIIINLPFIKKPILNAISNLARKRALKKRKTNIMTVLDTYGKQSLVEIYLYWIPEFLKDKSLKDANLKRVYDLNLVAVKRKNKVLNVTAETIIQPLDKVIIFGHREVIDDIFMDKVDRHAYELLSSKNKISIIDNYGRDALCEVVIRNLPEIFKDTKLSESGLKDNYNLQIMMVKNGTSHEIVGANTIIKDLDTIIVFGPYENIKRLFNTEE